MTRATAPESSRALKAALHKRFPATTFTVRLSRGTGYGNAHVGWTDGPSIALVDAVAQPFSGEGFNSSDDSSYGMDGRLPDGRRTGLRLINTSRTISTRFARRLVPAIAAYYGIAVAPDVIETEKGGRGWELWLNGVPMGFRMIRAAGAPDWGTAVYRASNDRQTVTREN